MKPFFALLVVYCLLIATHCDAQKNVRFTDDTTYYNFDLTKMKKPQSFYYRPPVEKVGEKYHVKYFRTRDNSLYYEGDVIPVMIEYHHSIEPLVAVKDGYFVYRRPDGNKWEEGNYVKDKLNGEWKYYHKENGNLRAVAYYYTNQPVAYGTTYFKDGITKQSEGTYLKVAFKNDTVYRRHDQWIYYFKKEGSISAIVNYTIGVLHDKVTFYDSATGNKYSEGTFNSNDKHGKWHFYNPVDNRLIGEINYNHGKLHDTLIFYHLSGNVLVTGRDDNGIRNGVWRAYYDSLGKVRSEITYRNSKGNAVFYDSVYSNAVILEGEMLLSARIGKWTGYYPQTGKVRSISNYKDNLLQGKARTYDEFGYLHAEVDFKDGVRSGDATYYYKGTKDKWVVISYDDDTMSGLVSYYRSGKMKRKTVKEKGEITHLCYSEDGGYMDCEPYLVEASFNGNLMTYIGDNLNYPAEAKIRRLQGKVKVGFTLDEWGKVTDPYIIEGFDDRCDDEALRLVRGMPNWIPATIEGIPVTSIKTVPVVFWLPEEEGE